MYTPIVEYLHLGKMVKKELPPCETLAEASRARLDYEKSHDIDWDSGRVRYVAHRLKNTDITFVPDEDY